MKFKSFINIASSVTYLLKRILPLSILLLLTGCEDFFETNPDNIINSDDYISAQSEMYSGYLGIITKMQKVGDQAVFLTDTRADFLKPTNNAPEELWNIYNYNDLNGNSFANPKGYYELIIACNDYFQKMFEYKESIGDAMDESTVTNYNALISSCLRVKVWAYMTLGYIYGEAYYFDDALTEFKNLDDNSVFTRLNTIDEVVDKCLSMLDNGINGISSNLVMDWGTWLDPENPKDGAYATWAYVVPDYLVMRSELCLLKGVEYGWVREQILTLLSETFLADSYKYRLNAHLTSNYRTVFASGTFYSRETISSIIYDYANNQTNNLITYFGNRYPTEFLLKPTAYAVSKYGESDARRSCYFLQQDGDTVVAKYHYNYSYRQPYQSDASVPLFRAHDLHFMLAEVENHLGNWDPSASILNEGISGRFISGFIDETDPQWDSRYQDWISGNTTKYPNIGICGCANATQHLLPKPTDSDYSVTEEERQKIYDLALLDEMLLEYAAEGRAYGMMIRMAKRYNDWSIVADRVCPKYPLSEQSAIREKIMNGGYFVQYDLE